MLDSGDDGEHNDVGLVEMPKVFVMHDDFDDQTAHLTEYGMTVMHVVKGGGDPFRTNDTPLMNDQRIG